MNKKVIKTMIGLVVIFLLAFYVLKIFFPQEFVMVIENPQLVKIGNFIDSNVIYTRICSGIMTFITYNLFICAVTRKWHLNWKELLCVFLVVVISRVIYFYNLNLATGITTIGMFIIPILFNKDLPLKPFVITYSIHYFSQLLSLMIRDLPMYLTNINSIIAIVLTFECYLWLILLYLYFNYQKEI